MTINFHKIIFLRSFFLIFLLSFFSHLARAYDSFDQMAAAMAKKFDVPTISVDELATLLNEKEVIILDAREKKEFLISHIKGAVSVGYEDIDMTKVLSIISKKNKLIIYCSVGYRSGDIAYRLRKKGFDAYNLYGGLFGWNNSGLPLHTLDGKLTDNIHGYNSSWSKWITRGKISY